MTLEPLTEELAARLGYEDLSGVVATAVKPGSPADEAGIQAGTLIMEVNRKPVRSVKGFTEAIEEAREEQKKEAMLRIRDDEWTRLVMLRLSDK
jgi:serine protease Do